MTKQPESKVPDMRPCPHQYKRLSICMTEKQQDAMSTIGKHVGIYQAELMELLVKGCCENQD